MKDYIMKIRKLVRLGTPANDSPAVYETDRGTLLIQGYKTDAWVKARVEGFAENREEVVEVPSELLALVRRQVEPR